MYCVLCVLACSRACVMHVHFHFCELALPLTKCCNYQLLINFEHFYNQTWLPHTGATARHASPRVFPCLVKCPRKRNFVEKLRFMSKEKNFVSQDELIASAGYAIVRIIRSPAIFADNQGVTIGNLWSRCGNLR